MFRFPSRLAPVLALLAVATLALPVRAVVYAGGGLMDADVYSATVTIPGGWAEVDVYVVRYRGADADTSGTVPAAEPSVGDYAFGCVYVQRGKAKDGGCGDVTAAAVSGDSQLATGRLKFAVPSMLSKGKGRLDVDLSLTATGDAAPDPYADFTHIPGSFVDVEAGVLLGRPATATGSVTSTKVGGGKVGTAKDGLLARDVWASTQAFVF